MNLKKYFLLFFFSLTTFLIYSQTNEPYQAKTRCTYKGKCIAIVKASANEGKITIKTNGENLKQGAITIDVIK